ncbi:MAG TPA: YdeI/OmpD-associated family protein [Acidobacteriaceae bacterium]
MTASRTFQGVLEPDGTSLGWTIVRVPFDPTEVWPNRKGLRVRGTVRAALPRRSGSAPAPFAFRTSLFRTRDGKYILLVNKRMQKATGLSRGSVAEIMLEADTEERMVATPPELEAVLRQDRALRRWHDRLSPSYRKAIGDLITQPKSPAARRSRAERIAEGMLLAMEGEHTTPPVLELAFNRQPRARAGWQAMTPIQRRGHLLGIFWYQSPESRRKRAEKAVEAAMRLAHRKLGDRGIAS